MSHYCVAARREAQPLFLGGTPPFAPHDGLSPMKVDHLRWAGFVGEHGSLGGGDLTLDTPGAERRAAAVEHRCCTASLVSGPLVQKRSIEYDSSICRVGRRENFLLYGVFYSRPILSMD